MTDEYEDKIKEILDYSFETFKERNNVYGKAHERHGKILHAMFPNGLELNSEKDFTRFMYFNAVIGKLNRYASNFDKGGHSDSIVDPINALAMLSLFDEENKNENS